MVTFPLEIKDPPPTPAELVLAASIAAAYPKVCCPEAVMDCIGCRCRHEAREMLAGRSLQ